MGSLALLVPLWLASAAPLAAQTWSVPGAAADALAADLDGEPAVWVTASQGGQRTLIRLDPGGRAGARLAVPASAVFVAACPGEERARLVFADADGLVDGAGRRLLQARSLFLVADPEVLYRADLCPQAPALRGELRTVALGGLHVTTPGGEVRVLELEHRGHTYSGQVHRGLQANRPYGSASSTYAPHLFDVDVDGDGDLDLVAVHEGRLVAWQRSAEGLARRPWARVDLAQKTGGGEGDLRVLLDDLDGDGKVDAVVGRADGILAERSSAFLLTTDGAPFGTSRKLWAEEGLVAPLSVIDRPRGSGRDPHTGPALLTTRVNTSVVALGGVVLSGEVEVPLVLRRVQLTGREASYVEQPGPTVAAAVDVRKMQMSGALPLATVDLDGDGRSDLLDVGRPGEAVFYPGTDSAYASSPAQRLPVPAFVHLVPVPERHGVVLIGAPRRTSKGLVTDVTWIGAGPPAPPGRRR